MRILTGKDRIEFERVLIRSAAQAAELEMLRRAEGDHKLAVVDLRADVSRERQRADNAVDELLALRGIAPISVPPEPRDLGDGDPFAEDPDEVAKIEQRMKAEGFGAVLGEAGSGGS
jgi:hypothetical protein